MICTTGDTPYLARVNPPAGYTFSWIQRHFVRSIEVIDQFRTASRNHPKSALHYFWNIHLDAKPIYINNKQQFGPYLYNSYNPDNL